MFDTLIAAMLAYYRAHREEVAVREVLGAYAVFAYSIHFHGWISQTSPWNTLPHSQLLEEQIALLSKDDADIEAQFETVMGRAFQLLFG
jgi:hypothetical protein